MHSGEALGETAFRHGATVNLPEPPPRGCVTTLYGKPCRRRVSPGHPLQLSRLRRSPLNAGNRLPGDRISFKSPSLFNNGKCDRGDEVKEGNVRNEQLLFSRVVPIVFKRPIKETIGMIIPRASARGSSKPRMRRPHPGDWPLAVGVSPWNMSAPPPSRVGGGSNHPWCSIPSKPRRASAVCTLKVATPKKRCKMLKKNTFPVDAQPPGEKCGLTPRVAAARKPPQGSIISASVGCSAWRWSTGS